MSSKNPEKSLQRSESHLFTTTAKETNCKLLRLSTKTKRMPFLKQENSATSIQLRFKELCGGFYPYTSVSEQETKVVSYAGVTFSFNSRMMAKKSWFGWPSEAQRPDMVRREDTKERSNQRFMPPIQRDVLSVFTKKFRSHRPVEILMNAPESPFSLTVWHNRRSSNEVWYVGAPLEKNKMAKFLSTAVKNAGLHREGKKEPINLSGNLYFEAP